MVFFSSLSEKRVAVRTRTYSYRALCVTIRDYLSRRDHGGLSISRRGLEEKGERERWKTEVDTAGGSYLSIDFRVLLLLSFFLSFFSLFFLFLFSTDLRHRRGGRRVINERG